MTTITPTQGAGDLTTMVTTAGNVHEITGGTRPSQGPEPGPNLFHSFDRFGVGVNDTARFNNETGLATTNILSRVTGGARSDILGTIQANQASGFPGANLFLLNPAGVVFGPGARLEVEGAFHVSTADYLRFEGEEIRFFADPAGDSSLTTAPVQAFGFLGADQDSGNAPEPIRVDGSTLEVPAGETLSLVGGDIGIEAANLTAQSGQITIASVASEGEVVVNPSGQFVAMGEFDDLGTINIDASTFNASGGGTVVIRGGDLTIDRSAVAATSSSVDQDGTAINIDVKGDMTIRGNNTIIAANSGPQDSGVPGGDAGNIQITARKLLVDQGEIQAGTTEDGDGGDIILNVESLFLENGAEINNSTRGGGSGGDIEITASDAVTISGFAPVIAVNPSGLTSSTTDLGDAGNIKITAPTVSISGGGEIRATSNESRSGDIELNVDRLTLTGGAQIINRTRSAPGGKITITGRMAGTTADRVDIAASDVVSSTSGSQDGGIIDLQSRVIQLSDGAIVTAESTATGNAGDISITASDTFRIFNGSRVSVAAAQADAGNIDITVGSLLHLRDGSSITTSVADQQGDGGNITIDPVFVVLDGGSRIIANTAAGDAGNIDIVTDFLFQSLDSEIEAVAAETGIRGTVQINSPDTDVIAGTLDLPESFLNVATLLGERCAARSAEGSSSFVVSGRGGVPPGPQAVLPDSVMDLDQASAPSNDGGGSMLLNSTSRRGETLVLGRPATMGCE